MICGSCRYNNGSDAESGVYTYSSAGYGSGGCWNGSRSISGVVVVIVVVVAVVVVVVAV